MKFLLMQRYYKDLLSTLEELQSKLIEKKPELTAERIQELIQEKKDKIGAGYLTDQGAVFLIASDLGITIDEPPKTDIGIKDLYAGAKEVSLETRMLNMSPPKQYSRKDGSSFLLRTMTVYDGDSTASVKLWDEKANLPGIDGLEPGDLVRIIKAYVKSDINGSPTINIGSGSTIEPTENNSDIPTIDTMTKDPSDIREEDTNAVISGTLDGAIFPMRFTNSRGQPGTALKLSLKGSDGRSTRVVLWGKDETAIPNIIPSGVGVRLFGVRAKQGMQGLEIHGNDATTIKIDGRGESEPIIARILASSKEESGDRMIVGVDRNKNIINVIDSSEGTAMFVEGDVIECMPSKAYGNSVWLGEGSFVRRADEDPGIPTVESLQSKIADIVVGDNVCIKSIILKKTDRRDIQTRSGETVSLSEMFVEDDSGQIWVKGWRDKARLIDKCNIGEIVSITGASAKRGLEERIELVLGGFSKITPQS